MAEEKVHLLQPDSATQDITWDAETPYPATSSSKISYGTSSSQHPTPLRDQQLVTTTDQRTVNSHTQQPAVGICHPASDPVIQQPATLRQTQPIVEYPYQAAVINVHPKDRYKHVRREMTHSYMLLSCFVVCCCNPIVGIIALILSLLSSGEADRNRMQEARCLGEASFWVSMIGIVLGIATIGAVFVYVFVDSEKEMNNTTEETQLLPPESTTIVIDPPPSYETYEALSSARLHYPQYEAPRQSQQQPAVLQQPTGYVRCTQPAYQYITQLQDPAEMAVPLSQPVSDQHPPQPRRGRCESPEALLWLSCFVYWFCNVVAGAIAMVLSVASADAMHEHRMEESRKYSAASFWTSMMGVTFGILTIIFVVLFVYFIPKGML